ncbi:Protein CBG04452 [Caenorhabditis briggsae]|nr:Protein CBG04452 [Caenorhabditis briggsae]CAP25149.2 Protein CBG04452 [Caenorhabditis briggsae]
MAGAMNGDEIFSAGYKPVAYISHDCTSDRKRVDLVLTLTRLCEIGHTCHYRIITDITNKWGREDLAPTDFHHDNMDQFPDFP